MESCSSTIDAENIASVHDGVDRRPWGIYVPPDIDYKEDNDIAGKEKEEDRKITQTLGGGYVRIIDARGKSFPCGFSRPIRSTATNDVATGKIGSRLVVLDNTRCINNDGGECEHQGLEANATQPNANKITITEERIHPEEALFLHMRGLLRIESSSSSSSSSSHHNIAFTDVSKKESTKTLSTKDLICIMLPECNIPLAAFLAYAHLRSQGYILTRYTDQRMKLLCKMQRQMLSTELEKEKLKNVDSLSVKTPKMVDETQQDVRLPEIDGSCTVKSSRERYRTRPLRLLLSDDVATAPPPCVVFYPTWTEKPANLRLAYYAYNPNAHFKRTNPGLPNFGVAVMPFRIGPTFDVLNSLVSLVEEDEGGGGTSLNRPKSGIPLRVVTVADGGAVIVFGVTNGDVPNIHE